MRTTYDLPERLLAEAVKLSGQKTKKATIITALETLVRQIKMTRLREFRGTFADFDVDLDVARGRNRLKRDTGK